MRAATAAAMSGQLKAVASAGRGRGGVAARAKFGGDKLPDKVWTPYRPITSVFYVSVVHCVNLPQSLPRSVAASLSASASASASLSLSPPALLFAWTHMRRPCELFGNIVLTCTRAQSPPGSSQPASPYARRKACYVTKHH
eukprot:3157363-Pleurochrysis_carterae.AAC.2